MWRLIQLPKIFFLIVIIIVEAYSPLNNFTKPTPNNTIVRTWIKTLFASLNL
jgi:hypothetical protein